MVHLPLSEQFDRIQNQAILKVISEESETPIPTVKVSDITLSYMTPEHIPHSMTLKIKTFKPNNVKTKLPTMHYKL